MSFSFSLSFVTYILTYLLLYLLLSSLPPSPTFSILLHPFSFVIDGIGNFLWQHQTLPILHNDDVSVDEGNKKGDEESSPSSPRFGTYAHARPLESTHINDESDAEHDNDNEDENESASEGGAADSSSHKVERRRQLLVRTDYTVYLSATQLVVEMPTHLLGQRDEETHAGIAAASSYLDESHRVAGTSREKKGTHSAETGFLTINDVSLNSRKSRDSRLNSTELYDEKRYKTTSQLTSDMLKVKEDSRGTRRASRKKKSLGGKTLGNEAIEGKTLGYEDRPTKRRLLSLQSLSYDLYGRTDNRDRDKEKEKVKESWDRGGSGREGGREGAGSGREAKRAPKDRQAVEGEYALVELPLTTAAVMHYRYCTVLYCTVLCCGVVWCAVLC